MCVCVYVYSVCVCVVCVCVCLSVCVSVYNPKVIILMSYLELTCVRASLFPPLMWIGTHHQGTHGNACNFKLS